jgi:hypothetical protein
MLLVSGIAFLTLVINGTSSGPVLQKLGLVTPSETRKKVIENYRQREIGYDIEAMNLIQYPTLISTLSFQRYDNTHDQGVHPTSRR